MILHLGNDVFVKKKDILMILNYQEAFSNRDTGLFLKSLKVEKGKEDGEETKSIVVTREDGKDRAYLSPISAKTLLKRSDGDAESGGGVYT